MVISIRPWIEIGTSEKQEASVDSVWRQPATEGVVLSADPYAVMGPTDGGEGASARSGGGEEISRERQAARAKSDYHLPVLMDEVLTALRPGSEKWIFDGTLGGGGHSEALLRAGASVIACDQDLEAIVYASARLAVFGERFSAVHANFGNIDRILSESGVGAVDGILLDLGVSSRHLDAAERGFSFQKDGPLDMRMNFTEGRSAADLVNEGDEAELARIFWEFGEERASRKIARAIVTAREKQPFTRTLELADLIASVLPRGGAKHPATRVFQALRIAVNEELVRLNEALAKSIDCLKPGGALAVITFHSLEDRIVKQFMRRHSEKTIDRPEWPAPKPNPEYFFDLPGRKPIAPSVEEQKANPRARSAKLRVAVRV